MSFREFKEQAKSAVEDALKKLEYPTVEFSVSEPPEEGYGDLAANVAFILAKHLRIPPLEVAQKIASEIKPWGGSLIESVTADPPGYINFKLNYNLLAEKLLPNLRSSEQVKPINIGKGVKVTIEHTSVNPNKALHIGHLRNVAIGDVIYRLLKHSGYDVKVLNYIDDSGAQVADVIVGFLFCNFQPEAPPGEKFDHYCGDTVYVKVNEMYEKNPALLEKQKQVMRELEDPNSEVTRLAKKITTRILGEQLKTCWRFGARYDCLNFESQIIHSKLWERLFEELKRRGIAKFVEEGRLKGCWIVEVEGEEGEEKVLVRADGTATYIAKDIPYAAWKLGLVEDPFLYREYVKQPDGTTLWATDLAQGCKKPDFHGADKSIVVIDVRQSRLQRIIKSILKQLAGEAVEERYIHLGYAVVSLSPQTAKEMGFTEEERLLHMSGRKGIYLNADDVLDALKKKALEETMKRNPGESLEWCERVSESIAVAALRFDLLKQDLDKMVVFDLNKALRLEGDTGPYILYSYVRASRILEKAAEEGLNPSTPKPTITQPSEKKLLKALSKFDLVVEEAVKNLSPKTLARYAIELATLFNNFYESTPVLSCSDEGARASRLMLVTAFKAVLGKTMELLGLPIVERM